MKKLTRKVAFITGASSGIGKETAVQLAEQGADLIITARRKDRIDALAGELTQKCGVKVLPLELDVTQNNAVKKVVSSLPTDFKNIDILVNNAGLAQGSERLQEGDTAGWDRMIDTNLKGLLYVARAIIPGMVERDSGHIVNVGSVAGHDYYATGNVYLATKHAVKALSYSLRMDLLGQKIRVTHISPGSVHTEFSEVRWGDKQRSDNFYTDFEPLKALDIADAIVYALTRPAHVNVQEMMIYPTDQASLTMINKGGSTAKSPFDD